MFGRGDRLPECLLGSGSVVSLFGGVCCEVMDATGLARLARAASQQRLPLCIGEQYQ